MTATADSPKALSICVICGSPVLFILLLNQRTLTRQTYNIFACKTFTPFPSLFSFPIYLLWKVTAVFFGCSSIRNIGRHSTLQVQSKVLRWASRPVFFPAWLQLQNVYFRPFRKYKASQLAGISTVGKGGSTKGDGSGMWFLGVKKQLFEDCKSLHDVGPVYVIMMTLDPITPESGSRHPCPTI